MEILPMPRSIRAVSSAVMIGSAIALCAAVHGQQQLPEPELRSPDELPPIPDVRELLATVNEVPIYADELEPLPVAKEKRVEEPGSEGFERWLNATRQGNLQHRVVQLIQARVAEENGLGPTEPEIASLLAFRAAQEDKLLADLTAMRDGLENEVTLQRQNGVEPPDQVLVELRRLRQEVGRAEQSKRMRERTDRDAVHRMQIAQRRFAEQTVTSWKFTQFIFQKYGGKVYIVGTSVQPIDAYLALFQEEMDAGRLTFETEWAKDAVIGAFESLRPQLIEPAGDTFAKPWWEMPVPTNPGSPVQSQGPASSPAPQ